jgi:beta-lactamase superfamily II metal-dependent hydrolase
MGRTTLLLLILAVFTAVATAQNKTAKTLDIYVIDVEGGNAVLFVTPMGESVLIDTGNTGTGAARDAGRIADAAKDAGLKRIDHLIITHYHGDHIGGLSELAKRIPIQDFFDHGMNIQPNPAVDTMLKNYADLYAKAKHTVVKPGDKIPVAGLDWRIVSAAGDVIRTPLPGAGSKSNRYCANYKLTDAAKTEDDQSVGSVITFGKFRTVHLGDLTLNRQFELMCPANRIGTVDLLLAARHGNVNGDFFVMPLHPRAVITNNGTRKGAPPDAMKVFFGSPGVQDVWQAHFSLLGGQEYTVPGMFIANDFDQSQTAMPIAPAVNPPQGQPAPPAPEHNGKAYYIKVSAQQDGTFTVTNTRNGFSKRY